MKVKDFMSTDFIFVEEYNIVEDVLIIMQKYRQLNLPVLDFSGHLIGNINARDLLGLVTREKHSLFKFSISPFEETGNWLFQDLMKVKNQYIREYMNTEVIYVHEEDSLLYAANLLLDEKLLTLPVVDDERKLVGVLDSIDMLYELLNYGEQ